MTAPHVPNKPPPVESPAQIVFTQEEIQQLLDNLDKFSPEEVQEIHVLIEELDRREERSKVYNDLIAFCQHMMPEYLVGAHHRHLAKLLMDIAFGEETRLTVSIAPRHGKSQMVSIFFIAWYLGQFPDHKVMLVSHTTDLAVDFGRKVRNLIATAAYKEIFPNTQLAVDSKSAGRWNTTAGGEFFAAGVGSSIAGRGAHLLVVDDAHSEQDVLNGNFEVFAKAYEWFTFGARTRLMPGGRVVIVGCLTAETPVLMADGSEKPIVEVTPGDRVVSYKNGELVNRKVLNWADVGRHNCYEVKTISGTIVKGNERHPFLINNNGVLEWVRIRDLKPNMMAVKIVPRNGKDSSANTTIVNDPFTPIMFAKCTMGENTEPPVMVPIEKTKGIGGNLREKAASWMSATSLPDAKACVPTTTTKQGGHLAKRQETPQSKTDQRITNTATASLWKSTTGWLKRKITSALSAAKNLTLQILEKVTIGYTWTTVTPAGVLGNYFVTPVTSSSKNETQKTSYSELLNTYEITEEPILSIEPCGVEVVYDIEVEETGNFVANGLSVHNTRWHQDDLIGRVIKDMSKNEKADQYTVVEFPAMIEKTLPDGTISRKALWPEFFDLDALTATKNSMPLFQWNAQFQQNPTAEEGAIVRREWWGLWMKDDPPECEYIIMTLDAASETHNRADFTAITTWGVFLNQETDAYNIILLNAVKERYEFHELKEKSLKEYKHWEPDSFIVEKKSAGTPLYQELRRMGIPASEYTPHRGTGDKMARLNSVSDIVRSGLCWVPATRWAEELVDEIASFPFGSHDDLLDCSVMALMRFRSGGFVRLPTDLAEEPQYWSKKKVAGYAW